jgi:hypothetical protein
MMRRVRTLALAGFSLLAWAGSCAARIHGEMYCWALDSELPVACDQEEEEEEVSGSRFVLTSASLKPRT